MNTSKFVFVFKAPGYDLVSSLNLSMSLAILGYQSTSIDFDRVKVLPLIFMDGVLLHVVNVAHGPVMFNDMCILDIMY